ncbi:SUR7/PalI family-domain-containing protein [Lineolata rhizophorae]|uniref:SUR7/PalI family-domain-containing protein n=1 Tax=Lineolata rhizophorae TaxID=578093 RepID=A0A6A6NS84_9PEZI|nr:SUR7/PalI family-domain-containing protein [Lineolata rhizophorae]
MGKLGRFACIFVPMGLTIASLICLLLVFLGGLNKGSSVQTGLYFMQADLSEFTANPDLDVVDGTDLDNTLLSAFESAQADDDLKDYYNIYIWNYCSGEENNGSPDIDYCSPRKASFWFNPVAVWGLENTNVEQLFPDELQKGLDTYEKVAKWMFAAYSISFFITVGEIVVGLFAICSRWGSFVTTIVSTASSIMTLAAAITSTALYGALVGTFESVLKPYKIHASLGRSSLSVVWLAVGFSWAAGLFWLFSTCCCSGRSSGGKGKGRGGDGKRGGVTAEKTPYAYERIGSPFLPEGANRSQQHHGAEVPLQNMGQQASAYEPFRHERV